MRGAALHVLGDLLGSVAALVAASVILATGWTLIDPILSVLVAVLLFHSAWALIRESSHLLLEGVPVDLDRDSIAKDIEGNVAGVQRNPPYAYLVAGRREKCRDAPCLSG